MHHSRVKCEGVFPTSLEFVMHVCTESQKFASVTICRYISISDLLGLIYLIQFGLICMPKGWSKITVF